MGNTIKVYNLFYNISIICIIYLSGDNCRPKPSVLLLPQGRQGSREEKRRSAFFFRLPGPMQMRLTCRDLSAGLRPAGIRVGFTAATRGVNTRCTNSNVHWKDWSSSIHAIIDTAVTAHRQLDGVSHCMHKNKKRSRSTWD